MRKLIFTLILSAGCVTTGTYNSKIAELEKLRADHDKAAADRETQLKEQISSLEAQKADVEKQLTAARAERDDLQKKLNDTAALADTLKARLEKLGQNVDKLTSEK